MLDATLRARILAVATRKLGAYGGFSREDIEDVAGEAALVIVERLGRSADEGGAPIADLEAYAATVTFTCCAHAIRQRWPERARLKGRVRYVLSSQPRFAIWDDAVTGAVCGRATMRGSPPDADAQRALDALVAAATPTWPGARRPDIDTPAGLTAGLDALFDAAGGPLELDRLIGAIARLGGLTSSTEATGNGVDPDTAGVAEPREAAIDDRRLLARLWTEIGDLPVRQRAALLLHMRDHAGAGVLWLLPLLGLASIRQIAVVLGIPALELAALWRRLPLDDHAIAQRLACTRQQVINLRMAGRKRLASRLRAALGDAVARPAAGNPATVSPSMEHET